MLFSNNSNSGDRIKSAAQNDGHIDDSLMDTDQQEDCLDSDEIELQRASECLNRSYQQLKHPEEIQSDHFQKTEDVQKRQNYQQYISGYKQYKISAAGLILFILNVIAFFFYFGVRIYYLPWFASRVRWFGIFCTVLEVVYMTNSVFYAVYLIYEPSQSHTIEKNPGNQYKLHVVIPCYKEDISVIGQTVYAALEMTIPKSVTAVLYLCDDNSDIQKKKFINGIKKRWEFISPSFQEFQVGRNLLHDCEDNDNIQDYQSIQTLNCRKTYFDDIQYISGRERKANQVNGKSENVNNALKNHIYRSIKDYQEISDQDLICIFDSDQKPYKNFVSSLVHVFDCDNQLALVVTPQKFYNVDWKTDIFNHYNVQFWDYILPCFDATNAIFCTGSNFIIRARPLMHIGGFPDETVTEDFELGIQLITEKYYAKYFKTYLAIGEAPMEIEAVFRQRSRWTKGAFQVLFKKNSPLFNSNLTFKQKFMYYSGFYTYIAGIIAYSLVYLVPILSLTLRLFPYYVNLITSITLIITVFLQQCIGLYAHNKKHVLLFYYSGVAANLYWYTYFKAVISAAKGRLTNRVSKFKETPKSQKSKKKSSKGGLKYVWMQYLLLVLSILALIYVGVKHLMFKIGIDRNIYYPPSITQKMPHFSKIDLYDAAMMVAIGINVTPTMLLIYYQINPKSKYFATVGITSMILQKLMFVGIGLLLIIISLQKLPQINNKTYLDELSFHQQRGNSSSAQNGTLQSNQNQTGINALNPEESAFPEDPSLIIPGITSQSLNRKPIYNKINIGQIYDMNARIIGNIVPLTNSLNTTYQQFMNLTNGSSAIQQEFFDFPLSNSSWVVLKQFLSQGDNLNLINVISLSTVNGLNNYSTKDVNELGEFLSFYVNPMIINFDREMNGQWYVWKMQPSLYIQKFQEFSSIIKNITTNCHMIWNPNTGSGYPDYGLSNITLPPNNSLDFRLLDTNHDGIINSKDDPYLPFYPGSQFVDIISISAYNIGTNPISKVNGFNLVPASDLLSYLIQDIYNMSITEKKPFALQETGSLWINLNERGFNNVTEVDSKIAWLRQIYNQTLFPKMKFVMYLQDYKLENQLADTCVDSENSLKIHPCSLNDQTVNWQFYNNSQIVAEFLNITNDQYFIKDAQKLFNM